MMSTCLNNQTEPQHTKWWNTNKKRLSPPNRSTSLQMEQFYLRFNQMAIGPLNSDFSNHIYGISATYHRVYFVPRELLPCRNLYFHGHQFRPARRIIRQLHPIPALAGSKQFGHFHLLQAIITPSPAPASAGGRAFCRCRICLPLRALRCRREWPPAFPRCRRYGLRSG